MKKKQSSRTVKNSLRGTGCLSAKQAGERSKATAGIVGYEDWRESRWMERLKKDMARAEQYFWRQTAARRKIFESIVGGGQKWGGNDFCFGKGSL